jgi:hypothetical protein
MRAYNLFRRKGEADLFCAVPQNVPVPGFVTADGRNYARPLDIGTLSGFAVTLALSEVVLTQTAERTTITPAFRKEIPNIPGKSPVGVAVSSPRAARRQRIATHAPRSSQAACCPARSAARWMAARCRSSAPVKAGPRSRHLCRRDQGQGADDCGATLKRDCILRSVTMPVGAARQSALQRRSRTSDGSLHEW